MSRLNPGKLHVRFAGAAGPEGPLQPRRYTLTHSDGTGDLYLTIGTSYDMKQVSGWYTRLMRDEVLAEWLGEAGGHALHVYCHVSGGVVFGSPEMRDGIFRRELPLVLEALRYGDNVLFIEHPGLDAAPIQVHFRAHQARYNRIENWGKPADYRLRGKT